jgi:hypothetical protein
MNKFLQPNTLENPVKATEKKKFQKPNLKKVKRKKQLTREVKNWVKVKLGQNP